MKFCRLEDHYHYHKNSQRAFNIKPSLENAYAEFFNWYARNARVEKEGFLGRHACGVRDIVSEYEWWIKGRPYYNVWPGIRDTLETFPVEKIPVGAFVDIPERCVCLQFQEGGDVQAVLVHVHDGKSPLSILSLPRVDAKIKQILHGHEDSMYPWIAMCVQLSEKYTNPVNGLVEQRTQTRFMHLGGNESTTFGDSDASLSLIDRVVLSVLLMERDPDLFTPDVLNADRFAFKSASKEQREAMAEKAFSRRGQRGWDIGREMETNPHYRRSHPALVWTGKGRTVPRIVIRRGCIVKRESMTKAPTGYHGGSDAAY